MIAIAAYLRKSWLEFRSYGLGFYMGLLAPAISVASFFFIDRLFGHRIAPHLEPFGVSYFSYVLVGMMTASLMGGAMGTVWALIREEQTIGTFEMLMAAPTGVFTLACAMQAWHLVMAMFEIAVYVLAGVFIFHVDFGNVDIPAVLTILALALTCFSAIGMLSAAFTLAFKRGDPVSMVMSLGMEVLGGALFPVTVLPSWLKALSHVFPTTYAIRALEMAVYRGAGLAALRKDVAVLAVLAAVLVPAGYWSLGRAFDYARRKGTLAHY
ncbi:MAG: ABC transporter permease [Elusimicrobia bacterium]|nr:ABC transporter permease [Elusimicrobiota bacterium]